MTARDNAAHGPRTETIFAEQAPSSLDAIEPTPIVDRGPRVELAQVMGRLARIEGATLVIVPEEGSAFPPEIRARRAVSCLVEPELNDRVLVSGEARRPGNAFVLAVLERETPNVALSSEGDLEVRLKDGRFRVAAQKGIDLVSPESVALVSNRISVHANAAKLVASEVVALASDVVAELTNVQLEGTVLDKVFERVSERVQRSLRNVEELDQVHAKQIDYVADESLSLRGEKAIISAKEIVKVENDPTHYG